MQSVVTLVTNPEAGGLAKPLVEAAREALSAAGIGTGPADWLDPGIACDLPFADNRIDVAEAAARAGVGGAAVDVFAQPTMRRRKRLLVADMDSTIVCGETLDELADLAGLKPQIAAITARAMNGEIDFVAALRERVAMLAGLSESTLAVVLERLRLTPGAATLVRTMRAAGAYTVLVSGGFRWFTRRIAERAGFDAEFGNELFIAGGRLTGTVGEPIVGAAGKLATLRRLVQERNLAVVDSLAVGDGANDLPMLHAAGLGVAFRAKPIVAGAVRCHVEQGDLTALLHLQGYRRDQFAS